MEAIKIIIVEGPDGAGKTTLINKMVHTLNLPVHARSANSDGSATQSTEGSRGANLSLWAYNDVTTQLNQPTSIYDRHCLISEFVYGPILRAHVPVEMTGPATRLLIQMLAKQVLVVYCRPPNENLVINCRKTPQPIPHLNDQNNVLKVAAGYDAWRVNWMGQSTMFDYTNPNDFASVMSACRLHIAHFENMRKS
jgi:hypothetical protein